MIIIETYIDKIWEKQYLTKQAMKALIKVCLNFTNHNEKNIFLNVSFVDAQTIKTYNKKFRGKDNVTNVLSFENSNKFNMKNTINLGEMVLCFEKIKQEAIEFNKPFYELFNQLFVHSIFQLLGYDHILEKDRIEMEALEEAILKEFNIYNPYVIQE